MSQGGLGNGVPGFTSTRETVERDFGWGILPQYLIVSGNIDSTAVDSTNTPTNILRPGLVMALLDSGAGWVDYDADATDGSEVALGVLMEEYNNLDPVTASAVDRVGRILIGGPVKGSTLIGLDRQARSQMSNMFKFDDDLAGNRFWPYRRVVNKAADYTVVAADNGTLFIATAAANFTLPTIAPGLVFTFKQSADANLVITTPTADNIIGFANAAADTLTFSTSSEKIGAGVRVYSAYIGSTLYWIPELVNSGVNTVVSAG